eukprot:5216234-Amphidinium_carterae.1
MQVAGLKIPLFVLMDNEKKDFYELLGLTKADGRRADFKQLVRKAYLQLSREHHPDKHVLDPAYEQEYHECIMRNLNDAKEILLDDDIRTRVAKASMLQNDQRSPQTLA